MHAVEGFPMRHRSSTLFVAASLLLASTGLGGAQPATTITIATHYNDAQIAPLRACLDAYEAENAGVAVRLQQVSYRDFLQTIVTSRIGGTAPDIYNVYSIWTPQLIDSGILAEPPAEISDFVEGAYSAGTVGAATVGGTLYGIPTELSVYLLLWNKRLFAQAGVEGPPADWAALEAAAARITRRNDQGTIVQAGYVYGPSVAEAVHVYYAQMFANGLTPYSDDLSSANFTEPGSVAIVEGQGRLFGEGITSNAVTTDGFTSGAAGMAIMANWTKAQMEAAFGEALDETVGVAPIPAMDGPSQGTMLYSFLWAVDAQSPVQAESWQLLRWLSEARDGRSLSCTGAMLDGFGALTGNLSDLAAMDTDDAFTRPFVEAIESGAAKSQPNIWQADENDRVLRASIERVWAGTSSAADAMESAKAQVDAILLEQ